MPNDTSISRVASEPNTIHRKTSTNEAIDLSQLSFFDELLSIGQFTSTHPGQYEEPSSTMEPATSSDEERETAPSEESAPSNADVSPVPTLVQQPIVALPAATETNSQPDASKIDRGQPGNKKSESQETKETAQKELSPLKAETGNVVPSVKTDESNSNVSDTSLNEFETKEPVVSDVEQESLPSNAETHTKSSDAENSLKTVEQSQGSSSSKDDDAANEDLNTTPVPRTPKDGTFDVSPLSQKNSDSEIEAVDVAVPRNKRAERLARQAHDSEWDTDSPPQAIESKPVADSSSVSTSIENDSNDSTLSSSSAPIGSIPIAHLPPVPVATFTLSGAANPSGTPRGNGDSGVAIAASANRGGTATGSSNTTLTGNTATQSRPDQGRAEVARGSSGTPITAYQEAKLVQRVLRGVEQLANGGGQVRLRLHPPELGSLQLSLRMEAGQVYAKLEVENSTAKDALLNNIQTLKDRMAEQGMKVGSFEVEVSTDSSGSGMGGSNLQSEGGSGGDSRWENAMGRFAQQNNNRLTSEPTSPDRKTGSAWVRTNGSLDLTV